MNKTVHFSNSFKTYFTKKITVHLNPFHPANVMPAINNASASLFLQQKMRRLISSQIKKISFFSRINIEALHFISEKITRHLKFL
jgi:hypothetical protein